MSSKIPEKTQTILPRIIRMRDAPFYLGVNKNYFNSEIRAYLTEIKIGVQGIAFDRLELDAWVDQYIQQVGKPANKTLEQKTWQKRHQLTKRNNIWHINKVIKGKKTL
jgi:predicted DNA-binding transcriptional regulator AlpA